MLCLGALEHEHPAQLFVRDAIVEHLGDLFEREAEVLQGEQPVEPREQFGRVVPVAGRGIDA